ncbi:hypothetical protein PIB30_062137 [Stylosanthes scabra]|uniref:BHLH domain-containing protein n=1 Tax=Stylosanthes scabra TaxID=79078 RepID=A0ABU6QLP7_9FABA|nr:hypothetical protein [Stylosanthes scabra]
MENQFKSWISQHLGMEEEEQEQEQEDGIIINQSHMMNNSLNEEQEFLMEIFNNGQQESSEHYYYYSSSNNNDNNVPNNCDIISPNNNNNNGVSFEDTTLKKSKSYNYMMSLEKSCSSSTTTCSSYVLSFEPNSSSKERRTSDDDGGGFEDATTTKKRKAKTLDHIMAERKRRQDLTRSIIQLSATIPGLKKMDKAYVISEALNYIKVLKDRIEELESQIKYRKVDSTILIKRSQDSSTEKSSIISCETTSDNNESSLEIEAKVLQKEVLIRIQCEKPKNNILLKIHALLDKLHLSIASNSVLPFGASTTVIITIVAQMDDGDKFSMTMDELVKSLREDLMETNNYAY